MGAVLSFFRPARVALGDWSQQELAEFYRVEAALTQSGLQVTSDRGLSDEGDPWFVFCRFDGDVILHFARIDGQYVVASDAFERPLQGPDFRALLNMVAAEHPTLVPLPRPDSNGRRGNLVLHPAALLAAIVASVAFQLAGGDAVAGELASDAPAAIGHADGAEAAIGVAGPIHTSEPDVAHRDALARLANQDDERFARQNVLILSVMAAITVALPPEDEAGPTGPNLGEGTTLRHRDQAASVPVAGTNADAVLQDARAQTHDASEAVSSNAQQTTGHMALVHSGQIALGIVQPQTGADGFDFEALSTHPLAGPHALVASAPTTAAAGPHGAMRWMPAAVSAEKAAPIGDGSGSTAASDPGTGTPAAHGAPSGTGASAPATKTPGDVGGETEGAASKLGAHPATGSGNLSAVSPSGTSTTGSEKALGVGATWTSSTTAQATSLGSSTSAGGNGSVLNALNALIDGLSTGSDASSSGGTGALDAIAKVKSLDPSFLSSAKALGLKTSADSLAGLTDLLSSSLSTKLSVGTTADHGLIKKGLVGSLDGTIATVASLDDATSASPTSNKTSVLAPTEPAAAATDHGSAGAAIPVAPAQAAGATLDTTALKLPVASTAAKMLDDQGRQLIARFLEATPQVQTFVGEHSFVMIDADAANYTNKDFSVRTWSVGPDMEISIVGISPELAHQI